MDLIDESGEIRATAFKAECDKFYEMIEIGKVYYITQGTLKAANKQYSNLNNDYELTFKDSTEVVPCTDEEETSKIPTVQFDFCKINQLDASLKVPFIYYVSTFIAQNLIWLPNFSKKLGFFPQKKKNFFFNITFWRNFHSVVWHFYHLKKKNAQKIRENVEVDKKVLT